MITKIINLFDAYIVMVFRRFLHMHFTSIYIEYDNLLHKFSHFYIFEI